MEASSLSAPEIKRKLFLRAFQKGCPSAGDPATGGPATGPWGEHRGQRREDGGCRGGSVRSDAERAPSCVLALPSRFVAWSRSLTLAGGRCLV